MPDRDQTQNRITLLQLAWTCFYIGVTGYGGPAIVGNMKQVFVDKKRWLAEEDFITGLSLSQLLPSAIGVNTIEFIGYKLCGSLGAIVAPLCFIAPATILMTVLGAVYFTYGHVPVAKSLFTGLGAIVVALILNAAVSIGKSAIKDVWAGLVALAGFVIVHVFHLSVLYVALIGAAAGFFIYRNKLKASAANGNGASNGGSRVFWIVSAAVPAAIVILLILTRQSAVSQLAISIFKVGSLTFGGGFMSIPLFQHEAVTAHHWLTAKQFLDGLALGQITPGPVLITANFIGYKVLGVLGALMGSAAVFLPGTLGMFVLAHQHEKVSHLLWLRAMIRGIVAGFMGVLLSVIVRLAMESIVDWKTASLSAASAVVLLAAKKDPLWVIGGGALLSLILFR